MDTKNLLLGLLLRFMYIPYVFKDAWKYRELKKEYKDPSGRLEEYKLLIEKYKDPEQKLEELSRLQKKYGNLEVKLTEAVRLVSSLPEIRKGLEGLSKEIEFWKVTREEMIANAYRRKPTSTTDMGAWLYRERINTEYKIREELKKQRNARIEQLERMVFDLTISSVVLGDSKIQNTAMLYYNPKNDCVFFTKKAKSLLGITELLEKYTFEDILRQLEPEYRLGIIRELKRNKKLLHYKTKSINNRELCLTTFDFRYEEKVIGYGVLLYDPKVSIRKLLGFGLVSEVKYLTERVNRELEKIGKVIHGIIDISPRILKPENDY